LNGALVRLAEKETTMGPRTVLLAAVAAITLLAPACGGPDATTGSTEAAGTPAASASAPAAAGTGTATETAAAGGATLEIRDLTFPALTVPAGTTVTVSNADSAKHTVTADGGEFDVEAPPGESPTFTAPAEPGEYAYHCEIHSTMTGTLTVE
jgi:plastocyanin